MKDPNHPKPKSNPSGSEVMQLMTAALQAADELGLDSVAAVREVLETEGFVTKPKNENS